MNPLQQKTLQVAKRYVGVSEDQGSNRGQVVALFQMFIGRWMLGQPWCAAFATFCIHRAAKELETEAKFIKSASSSQIFAWARASGYLLPGPAEGCVGLVKRGGFGDGERRSDRGKTHIHTFLVHTVTRDHIVTIEGNLGNRVKWGRRPRRDLSLEFVRIV